MDWKRHIVLIWNHALNNQFRIDVPIHSNLNLRGKGEKARSGNTNQLGLLQNVFGEANTGCRSCTSAQNIITELISLVTHPRSVTCQYSNPNDSKKHVILSQLRAHSFMDLRIRPPTHQHIVGRLLQSDAPDLLLVLWNSFHLDNCTRRVNLGEVRPSGEFIDLVDVKEESTAEYAMDRPLCATGEARLAGLFRGGGIDVHEQKVP